MAKSKVFFTDLNTGYDGSRINKFENLIKKSEFGKIDLNKKFVAIKIHFGEKGNLSYLRHNYAKVLVDYIKEKGGIPFLTDCNTLYAGYRKHAIEHLETAYANGYLPYSVGCPIIIGDGLKGDDDVEIPINGKYITKAKIGRAIVDADVVVTMSHFKGHELAGIGGAVKNLAMGCASRRGKMEQHCASKPKVIEKDCKGCKFCMSHCGSDAIIFENKKAKIDQNKCVGCGMCISACRFDAIFANLDEATEVVCEKMVEYAYAAIKDKANYHFSFAIDITPHCDCHGGNERYVVPDVGFFASADPVAIDNACAEMVNKQPIIQGTLADNDKNRDLFGKMNEITNWKSILEHGKQMKLGNPEYELKKI